MNHTMIAGHLGADPEVRFTSSGQKVTTLRVAARARKGSKDETIWWRVSVWGEQFDKMIAYFKKGSSIIVMGEIHKPEIFTDRDGKPQISMSVTATSISFSPFGKPDQTGAEAKDSGSSMTSDHSFTTNSNSSTYGQSQGSPMFSDDEVPF
ncbi:MAG: single-stranded DNA-binding protein [Candidatus Rhabdochlamydia sp.]